MIYRTHEMDVYYKSIGSGLPILMIHGWGPDHRSLEAGMESVLKVVKGEFKRIYLDLPGLGNTKGNDWLVSTDRMLELLLDFIDGIIPKKKFLLVGESYGGYLARGIIRSIPERVLGMLLKCPLARHETQFQNAPKHNVIKKNEDLESMLSEEEKSLFFPVTVIQTKKVWKRFKKAVLPGLQIADYAYINEHWGKQAPYSFDVDDIKKPFEAPVLILLGKQDSMVGYSDSWNYLKNYTRASFVILDRAGHNLQIEQPKLFKILVKEWFERVKEYQRKESKGA
jgi:pimeloyl-ACP methyl ester carboxylesterase